jgi:hypothetical protein
VGEEREQREQQQSAPLLGMLNAFINAFAELLVGKMLMRLDARSDAHSVPRIMGNADEFGFAIGMSGQKVRRLLRRGLPHIKIGAQIRIYFHAPEVHAWLHEHGDYLDEEGDAVEATHPSESRKAATS